MSAVGGVGVGVGVGLNVPAVTVVGDDTTAVDVTAVDVVVDVVVVGAGVAGRAVTALLEEAGRAVELISSAEPAWGIDMAPDASPDGGSPFVVYTSRVGRPARSISAAVIVLTTGTVAAPAPWLPDSHGSPPLARADPGRRSESALGRSLGCASTWVRDAGGWVLDVDERMRTSIPGVYAIGGALDAESAGAQARLVVDAILQPATAATSWSRVAPAEATASADLDRAYRAAPDDLVVCPCEGIALGSLRSRTAGLPLDASARDTKLLTRLGMGECQGRICGHLLAGIDEAAGREPTPLQPRAPIIPLLIPAAHDASRKDPNR